LQSNARVRAFPRLHGDDAPRQDELHHPREEP
jgi:hypothetical protein